MNELQKLIEFLNEEFKVEVSDLLLNDKERGTIFGMHEVIKTIEEIELKGYPDVEDK